VLIGLVEAEVVQEEQEHLPLVEQEEQEEQEEHILLLAHL
jgi:hypothetical protein